MTMKYVLGIDTSCYTTSFAVVSLEGQIIYNSQVLLDVEKGKLGLRQSNAIFKHLQNIPNITNGLKNIIDPQKIVVVSSTTRPRPLADSYMPVFLVSTTLGRVLSDFLKTPFCPVSHQECHIAAGRFSAGGPNEDEFLAIHFSGGTSELLKVSDSNASYNIEIIGNTQDLHAGQFVDRIGVAMGLDFPAGPQLEDMAALGRDDKITLPIFVRDMIIGFSGAETYTKRLLERQHSKEDVAIAVYNCLADTLHKWIVNAVDKTGLKDVLLVGGVTSSDKLRKKLCDRFKNRSDIKLYFADPQLAKDNAVGAALLGLEYYEGMKYNGS